MSAGCSVLHLHDAIMQGRCADCKFDREPMQPEKGVTDKVLAWLMGLHDRQTVTAKRPFGEEFPGRSSATAAVMYSSCRLCWPANSSSDSIPHNACDNKA